jgi:hypothetical protein
MKRSMPKGERRRNQNRQRGQQITKIAAGDNGGQISANGCHSFEIALNRLK